MKQNAPGLIGRKTHGYLQEARNEQHVLECCNPAPLLAASLKGNGLSYVPPQRIGFRQHASDDLEPISKLASRILIAYSLEGSELRIIATHSNFILRVDVGDGRTYALRIGKSVSDPEVDVPTELAWLGAVTYGTSVRTARPVRNTQGELITLGKATQTGEPRQCVLFSWVSGIPLAESLSEQNYWRLGAVAAELHTFGEDWSPAKPLRPLVWDRMLYVPSEPLVIFDQAHSEMLSEECLDAVRWVFQRGSEELTRLHRKRPMYIHGDIEMWNVMVERDQLTLLDFEDVMLGFPIQDIAITLYYGRERKDYPALLASFQDGYETCRPWPVEFEGQLELLMACRTVRFMNHALRTRADPRAYLARASASLIEFLG